MPVVISYVGSKFYDNGDGLISPNGEIFYTMDAEYTSLDMTKSNNKLMTRYRENK